MSAVDLSLNYEDLLQTVKESDRGRWFLTEFENRLRKSDTGNILASIAKLEGVIAGMGAIGGSGADAALVARAKSAIAAARKEIAALDASKAELSDEGRLFSKLADMARTAFSTESQGMNPVNAGVCRALLLVDQLDQDFAAVALPTATTAFSRDADVFETPATAKIVEPAAKFTAKVPAKDIERGARLVIRKAGQEDAKKPEVTVQPDLMEAAPLAPVIEDTPPAEAINTVQPLTPPVEKQSRVVIIRRKPEELMDVPMVDDAQAESAA